MLARNPQKTVAARAAEAFANHKMARTHGWSWRVAKPGTGVYAFRVTWAPGMLVLTGDVGDIVVRHYSFDDPWSAAAWVNGAGFDYFMEKTPVKTVFDPESTAEGIVERAYRRLRESGETDAFEAIIDATSTYGEQTDPEVRKEACRELMNGDLTAERAYEITEDSELLLYSHPDREQWHYEAVRFWARAMWAREPVWHKVVRFAHNVRAEVRDLRRFPILWDPLLYAAFDEKGRVIRFNGARVWTYRAGTYVSVGTLRVAGVNLSRFGLWQRIGSTWPDERGAVDQWGRLKERFDWQPLTHAQIRREAA